MKYVLLYLLYIAAVTIHCESYDYDIKYFEQKVDNFGYANNDTFQQRYLINSDFFEPSNGPIFFYTGNEGDIEIYANHTGFIWEIAPQFSALIVFAEHRYYGKTLPYGEKSYTDNKYLGYLTSEQALADFANLIRYLRSSVPGAKYSPVIAFGGSYGGMLAAYIRMKYPYLVNGALASSAPILQFQDLTPCERYNEIITKDFAQANSNCAKSIRRSWEVIRNFSSTESGIDILTKTFKPCESLSDSNIDLLINWLYSTWSSLAMTDFPYPTDYNSALPANPVNKACKYLKRCSVSDEELMVNIFKAASVYHNYTGNTECFDLKKHTSSRLGVYGWWYQACTEMVMPMCRTGISDMFEPKPWNFTEYSQECFDQWKVKPDLNKAVIMYGGKNITSTSNIIFTNGKLDPWSGGSVLKSLSFSLIAIQMDRAPHHMELRPSNPNDPTSVKRARTVIKSWIYKWISAARNQ